MGSDHAYLSAAAFGKIGGRLAGGSGKIRPAFQTAGLVLSMRASRMRSASTRESGREDTSRRKSCRGRSGGATAASAAGRGCPAWQPGYAEAVESRGRSPVRGPGLAG